MGEVITERVGKEHIAWFENSNSWISFEEPAWLIFSLLQQGKDDQEIISCCSETFQISETNCRTFLDEIKEKIKQLNQEYLPNPEMKASLSAPSINSNSYYSIRFYSIGNAHFRILYGNRTLEYYIHPSLAYLESESRSGQQFSEEYSLVEDDDKKILLHCQNAGRTFSIEEYGRMKMRMFIELANLIYGKKNEDWMALIHASGVTDGRKAILFSAECGGGKTTLAAILQTRGLEVIGDDFIPVDHEPGKAFPFPAALSVKASGIQAIKQHDAALLDGAFSADGTKDPPAWFLKPKKQSVQQIKPLPIAGIVFLKYDPDVSCNHSVPEPINAFKRMQEQAWISGKAAHVKSFLSWFEEIPFFNLTYSDIDTAMDWIQSMFNETENAKERTKKISHEIEN